MVLTEAVCFHSPANTRKVDRNDEINRATRDLMFQITELPVLDLPATFDHDFLEANLAGESRGDEVFAPCNLIFETAMGSMAPVGTRHNRAN